MADELIFQKHFVSMRALGRNFKLGDLYNYRNDQILPGIDLMYFIRFLLAL